MSELRPADKRFFSIRRRLVLSFSAIILLFALNLAVYEWSNAERKASVEALRTAIARQILIADIHQRLNDTQKRIALLSQAVTDAPSGDNVEEVSRFRGELDHIRSQIAKLAQLSDTGNRKEVEAFAREYQNLSASWLIFFQSFGVDNVKAILELSVRGEPLGQHVLQQTVPQLLEAEKRRVDAASTTFYSVGRIADRLTFSAFVLSGLVAAVVAFGLARHITRGLEQLKAGATLIGEGELDHRIALQSNDELGDLAQAFDNMSGQLSAAHGQLTQAHNELAARHREVEQQREISDSLLLNILPSQIAEELKTHRIVEPKFFEDVTILFTDFVAFSGATQRLSAEKLVGVLDDYFTAFDCITSRYCLEKLKTIGDSYMCVSGMPARTPSHAVDSILAAFEMLEAVRERAVTGAGWQIRIGLHTGPVAAGVVGIKKFAFDIWGEAVNLSSRMESCGAPGRINISSDTYTRVSEFFNCEYRGQVITKDKTAHHMYFVLGALPSLLEDDGGLLPPPLFARRYSTFFQRQLTAFPVSLLENPAPAKPGPVTIRELDAS